MLVITNIINNFSMLKLKGAAMLVLVAQSCPALCDPMDSSQAPVAC